jgi:cytochrome c oxidase cbb3-type subunit 3
VTAPVLPGAPPARPHTYDGIAELDSRLPNWWLWTFYLAILYSIGYWVHYHTLGTGDQPSEAYVAEQKAAAAIVEAQLAANPVNEAMLLKLASEPAFVAEGERIFKDATKCALCHKADASGSVGPNLTDDMWIYGSKPMDVYTTILKGREQNLAQGFVGGMQSWEAHGMQFVLRTTAYVLSIRNTNVPGKPPEPNAKKDP